MSGIEGEGFGVIIRGMSRDVLVKWMIGLVV